MHKCLQTLLLVSAILTSGFLFLSTVSKVHAESFFRDLYVGSVGEDVRALQVLLNENTATQLALSGPGSPGQETHYFGVLTKLAVARFQNFNASSILTPVGLSQGTGFFGPSTRAHVARVISADVAKTFSKEEKKEDIEEEVVDLTLNTASKTKQLQETAREYFDDYAVLVRQEIEESISSTEVDQVLESIENGIEEADYGVFFEKQESLSVDEILEKMRKAGASPTQETENVLREVLEEPGPLTRLFFDLILPERAYALTPYGTLVNVPIPCVCTGGTVWQMYLTGYIYGVPTEFTLDYVVGTQGFLSYTIPIAQHQLGYFIPGGASCVQGFPPACVPVPSFGTVSPVVGSSLL